MKLSHKQIQVLMAVGAGNPDGSPIDLDQLLEVLTYRTTKASIQFSIRALINRGLMEKRGRGVRRGRKRITYGLTDLGRMIVRTDASETEMTEDDAFDCIPES